MRVTNQMRRSQLLYDLERLQNNLYRAQNVLSDGREVSKGSDDPVRAQKALAVRSSLARRSQYLDNVSHGMSFLGMAEASLMSVNDLLADARASAVEVANDASAPEARDAAAKSIDMLLEEMYTQANSRQDGAYLFGGFNTQVAPYEAIRDEDTGEITQVIGRPELMDGAITVMADRDLEIQINMNGNQIFQTGSPGDDGDLFQILIDLRDALRDQDNPDAETLIEDSISRLDGALELVQGKQADLGARYNRLQSVEQHQMDVEIQEQDQLGDAEDGDLAQWVTRFELQSIALQQAVTIGSQVLNASILNFIR